MLARLDLVDADARLALLEGGARGALLEEDARLPLEEDAPSLLGARSSSRILPTSWKAESVLRARGRHDHTHLLEHLLHSLRRLRARLDIQALHLCGVRSTFIPGYLRNEHVSRGLQGSVKSPTYLPPFAFVDFVGYEDLDRVRRRASFDVGIPEERHQRAQE